MSKIVNEARIKNPLIVGIREQLEHRALWLYLLCDEAAKHGLKAEDFAPDAIKRCGLYQGKNLVEKGGMGQSLRGLKKALFGYFAQQVFEMDILRCDDDHLDIDFHYCPLVKAWQKQGCSDEEIAVMCDHAMCGDRGIGETFGVELDLPGTIAKGDATCQLRYVRREGKAEMPEGLSAQDAEAIAKIGIGTVTGAATLTALAAGAVKMLSMASDIRKKK